MSNFMEYILTVAEPEAIEAIVIGDMGWGDHNAEKVPEYQAVKGKVLKWEEAIPFLDYEYDNIDSPECQAITAWTANKVIFVSQYDHTTHVDSVPRYPIEHMPEMPGG